MLVFFFKQKTAYEMRISDWSSDVCSSDLARPGLREALAQRRIRFASTHAQCAHHPFKFMREMHLLTQRRDAALRFEQAHRDLPAFAGLADHVFGGGHCLVEEHFVERSEEHTSELQSLMRTSYAVFCLKKKKMKLQTIIPREKKQK